MTETLTPLPRERSDEPGIDIVAQTVGAVVIRLLAETHAKGNSVEIPSIGLVIAPNKGKE